MDKIIVYVDDATHALQQLAPVKHSGSAHHQAPATPTHWVLVACAPRMTQHISKWVSHSARENWRAKWSEQLFAKLAPTLKTQGDTVTTLVARGPLIKLTDSLLTKHAGARVLDARCARFGQDMPPVIRDQPMGHESRWTLPGAAVGVGALLVLAAD